MKKKLLSAIFAVILLLSLLPAASAETVTGTCGENATWTYYPDTSELVISGTGAMYGYSEGKQPWYKYSINLIVVEDGITSIGRYAFAGCCASDTVIIGKSVADIDTLAFGGYPRCVVIDSPTIAARANTYDSVGYLFFLNTTVLVNKNINTFGYYIRSGRTNETDVRFRGEEYTAYSRDTTHQYQAYSCETFTGLRCSSCWAPADCNQTWDASATEADAVTATLTPDTDGTATLTFSGNGAIADCSSGVYVPWSHYYPIVDEVIFEEGISYIGKNDFDYFIHITSATIPESMHTIANYAFSRCKNLASVTIPAGVTTIGEYAFNDCTALTITGYTGSNAETYAAENNIPFIALLRGNFVDDGVLSSTDAVYLLYHTLLPEKYPIGESGDINGDGTINQADAVYLLYHVLLPELYPL